MQNTMSTQKFEKIYHRYKNLLYRITFTYVKKQEDCEDILQEVFLKRLYYAPIFESEEYEKRWLIRICVNLCKNHLHTFWNRNRSSIEEIPESMMKMERESRELLTEVLNLPDKCKAVIYLHYYEGYNCREVAEILNLKESAVKMRLKRGREILGINLMEEGMMHEYE